MIFDFLRSFGGESLGAENFLAARKFFDGAKISEKKVWVDASDSVKKSSKSELSSRFLSRLKFENSLATFG